MSSIRLFILSSFATHGEMHGHQVRTQAEQEYVHLWTDISVGSVYGAIKRLAGEGLLEEVRSEQDGNRPARQIYAITAAGRDVLAELRHRSLRDIWWKFDPFDLALTRVDPDTLTDLPEVLSARLAAVRDLLEQTKRVNADALEHVSVSEKWALRHTEYRLQAEVSWLEDLIAAAPDIVADEQSGVKPTRG
ncbi:PadR family transcriptional regulator [Actinomadura sp. 9N407]|uniref:PadR family transcriptional regulator n=1 Tax=Actinomadura sp. 9N407 TaxID=3375154 RepID=UPI0037B1BAE2